MSVTVAELVDLVEDWAPAAWAEDWDQVGLQVGEPAQRVSNCLVALDLGPGVGKCCREVGGQTAVMVHHPPIFKGLQHLRWDQPGMGPLGQAVREGAAIVAAHTNLDLAPGGTEDVLADVIGLASSARQGLVPGTARKLFKLVVFVPVSHSHLVWDAMVNAGAGAGERYDGVGFRSAGIGTFRPLPGAAPYAGVPGKTARVDEERLETVVARERVEKVLGAAFRHHPYEEPAYEVHPLEKPQRSLNFGRIGELERPETLQDFCARLRARFSVNYPTCFGPLPKDQTISAVATAAGSGGDQVAREAWQSGAQVLVTGEMKYPQVLEWAQSGLTVIQVGHGASEDPVIPVWASYLRRCFAGRPGEINVRGISWQENFAGLGAGDSPRM